MTVRDLISVLDGLVCAGTVRDSDEVKLIAGHGHIDLEFVETRLKSTGKSESATVYLTGSVPEN